MRLHVVSLPHTQLAKAYSCCAYTEKVRKFRTMMELRGHEVFAYASEDGDAISCITKDEQGSFGFAGPDDYLKIDFNATEPWATFNANVIREIRGRIMPGDLICLITGDPAKPIAEAFPDNISVEFGVGYSGIAQPYCVFESYAWRNFCYGKYNMDGRFYDTVIPNYFEVDDFPFSAEKEDYYLFVGRVDANKGLPIAQEVCEKLGLRLVVAGPGHFTGYGEYVGVVGPEERGQLMSEAIALFAPTRYVAPFEGVHVEAMLCGTPVITTDFGVFSETVGSGSGVRCNTFQEFCDATEQVKELDPYRIAEYAAGRFSTDVVAAQYERYFERLLTLYEAGWYSKK
jgi:glycosyltransferase involved in cell wall biosynthesis